MQNTSEIVDCGTHYRTSPFSRAVYRTTATRLDISAWNNVYTTQAAAAEIGVYVDGSFQESVRPTADGPSQHTVTLSPGEKVVSVVTGGFRGMPNPNVATTIGLSMWIKRLSFNAPAEQIAATGGGLVIVGDSIANGSTLASAITQAYPRLMQAQRPFPIAVVGRGGMALHDITTRVGSEDLYRPTKLVREVLRHNPATVLYTLGFNDAFKGSWGGSDTAKYIEQGNKFLRTLYEVAPWVEVLVFNGLLYAAPGAPNYAEFSAANNQLYYDMHTVFGTIMQVYPRIAVPALTSTDISPDGIHPNAAGHAKIAAALLPKFPANQVPVGMSLPATMSFKVPTAPAQRRLDWMIQQMQFSTASGYKDVVTIAASPPTVINPNYLWRYFEVSVNGGAWLSPPNRMLVTASGTENPVPAAWTILPPGSPLLADQTVLRIRRRGGNGDVLSTITVDFV